MKYEKTTPCENCPFRSDVRPYLKKARVLEIERGLVRGDFPCHKTTVPTEGEDGEGDLRATENSQHCAGALIILEKMERPSQMMRICERLGLYDARKLNMAAPVYDSFRQMVNAQGKRTAQKATA